MTFPHLTLRPSASIAFCAGIALLLAVPMTSRTPEPSNAGGLPPAARSKVMRAPLGASSSSFVENLGQWDGQARFLSRTRGADIWLTESGAVYDFHRAERVNGRSVRRGHIVRMEFVGGTAGRALGEGEVAGRYNYFVGNDRSKWASNVPRYSEVRSERVYDGVEARWYFDHGSPRYDLIVAPGADPSKIAMRFEGAGAISAKGSALRLKTSLGDVEQRGLFSYQKIDGAIRQVPSSFRAQGSTVRFEIGDYDRTKPLVIDPIIWSTFLGGSSTDSVRDVMYDASAANFLVCGETASPNFPVTVGAYDSTKAVADFDIFVSRLSADGSSLLFGTFVGSPWAEQGHAIGTDSLGNIIVAGATDSPDFPVVAAHDPTHNQGNDAVLLKLSPTGSTLIWSTYLGGASQDFARDLVVIPSDGIYVVGDTYSIDFPIIGPAFDADADDFGSCFVARYTATGIQVGSTYFGGAFQDSAVKVAADAGGNILLAGNTDSDNLPVGTGFDMIRHSTDGYVVKFDPTLATRLSGSFVGGHGYDQIAGMSIGPNGNVYLTGSTQGTNFPTTEGAFDETQNGLRDAFLVCLDGTLSTLVYGSFFGGSGEDYGQAVHVDSSSRAALTGLTRSANFPTTVGAYDNTFGGDADVFLVYMNSAPGAVTESTFIGGVGYEQGSALQVLTEREVILAGAALSPDFPTTIGAFSETHSGSEDVFLMRHRVGATVVAATVAKPKFVGGFGVPITFTFSNAIGPGGATMLLQTDTPGKVFPPASTKLKEGSLTKQLTIRTESVKVDTVVSVLAELNGVTVSTSFTLTPGGLQTLKIPATSVSSLALTYGTVSLSAPVPAGVERIVAVRASNQLALFVPTEVAISAGADSANFPLYGMPVLTNTNVTVSAKLGTMTRTDTITVTP